MKNNSKEQFEQLLSEANDGPNIIGFFLGGSRGKGFETELSDYDPKMIVKDNVVEEYEKKFDEMELEDIDLVVSSYSDFKEYARWEGPDAWDRYDFSHVDVVVDKSGDIQKLVKEKGAIPKNKKKDFISASLDGYINGVYRSVKAKMKKLEVGSRLEASASIPYLLDVVFAFHDRLKPFYGYLERELEKHPLEKLSWSSQDFLEKIVLILSTGDIKTQQELLKGIEELARAESSGQVFDDWEGKDRWAMEYEQDNI